MSSVHIMVRGTGRGFVRAIIATDEALTNVVSTSDLTELDKNYLHAKLKVNGLASGTLYFVGFELNGILKTERGRFRTPAATPHNFSFAFGSCWNHTWPDNRFIFNNISNKADNGEIDFFFHLGDIHYADIEVNNEGLFHKEIAWLRPNDSRAKLMTRMPMYYMWDDHDYGPNNSSSNSPSRPTALKFFRNTVPVTCESSVLSDGVYYSFIRGRVRFIVTDVRSERTPAGNEWDPVIPPEDRYVLSPKQEQWFKSECLAAQSAGQSIVWANTYPFVTTNTDDHRSDSWGAFHLYRQQLVDWMSANNLNNRIVIIAGDMHALAYDDGTSTSNVGALKVCHAAPLDTGTSQKGGPYLLGPITTTRTQYGLMDVTDAGTGNITFRFRGISVSESSAAETVGIDQTFTLLAA